MLGVDPYSKVVLEAVSARLANTAWYRAGGLAAFLDSVVALV